MRDFRTVGAQAGLALAVLLVASGVAVAGDSPPKHPYGATASDPVKVRGLAVTPEFRDFLPEMVDLSQYFPVPGDQGNQGSCTGWAVGYAARAYYAAAVEDRRIALPQSIPSPAFLYNQNVGVPGDCESGSSNILALDTLKYGGALSLADYPYDPDRCDVPSSGQIAAATDFKIADYRQVDFTRVDQIKGELADGNPVIIRIVPDDAFDNLWDKPRAVWHSPPLAEDGFGHAITLVGYNEAKQTFKFINSWGPDWSDGGYGRMDYQTFMNRTTEAFVMQLAADTPALPIDDLDPEQAPAPEEPIMEEAPVAPADPAPKARVDLAGLQCAKVQIATRAGQHIAEGFVSRPEDLETVTEDLGGEVDAVNVALAPWPQCEALLTLDAQLGEKDAPKVSVSGTDLKAGDKLTITVETPDFDSYVHVAYIQADGTVVNLQQVDADHLKTLAPLSTLIFGDGEAGRDSFEVSGPFGDETLLVITSRSPLFAEPRPETETEREFLSALREAVLARPDKASPERFISAAYVPIHTAE
ncbi:C1 family peptidase [Devosia sp.]|uniref:C1 family peptidase n=1 Tax=Devosia sp. TaxID=1871048 RepID=UPI003BAD7B75